MTRTLTVFFAALVVLGISSAAGPHVQRIPNARVDSLLVQGIDLVLRQEYEAALSTFRQLTSEVPEHPAGYLYQAGTLQAESMDYMEHVEAERFDSLLDRAKELAEGMIQRSAHSPWGYYFLGTALGYESYASAERGDWFAAATKGLSAASNFERAFELDSTFFDAYAGLGTYYYWKTRKIEFLTWIPFIGDRRAEGVKLLERCMTDGTYNRFAAMSSLIAVLIDAGRFERAGKVARTALSHYPENRIFLWGLSTALERGGDRKEAIQAYERLLQAILNDRRPNAYNELVCRLNLLRLRQQDVTREETLAAAREILSMEGRQVPHHLKERAREKFEKVREIIGQLMTKADGRR